MPTVADKMTRLIAAVAAVATALPLVAPITRSIALGGERRLHARPRIRVLASARLVALRGSMC